MLILAPFVAMAMGREFARPPGAMGCKLYIPWKETNIKDGMGTSFFLGYVPSTILQVHDGRERYMRAVHRVRTDSQLQRSSGERNGNLEKKP